MTFLGEILLDFVEARNAFNTPAILRRKFSFKQHLRGCEFRERTRKFVGKFSICFLYKMTVLRNCVYSLFRYIKSPVPNEIYRAYKKKTQHLIF